MQTMIFGDVKKYRRIARLKVLREHNLGFKFNRKPIRKHGVRINWKICNESSRQGICLVCKKRSDLCTCKIEIIDNQIHL